MPEAEELLNFPEAGELQNFSKDRGILLYQHHQTESWYRKPINQANQCYKIFSKTTNLTQKCSKSAQVPTKRYLSVIVTWKDTLANLHFTDI